MKRVLKLTVIILGISMLLSCATRYHTFDSDYNGEKFDGEYSEKELEIKGFLMKGAVAIIDFDSSVLPGYVTIQHPDQIERGQLFIGANGDDWAVRIRSEIEFSEIYICYKLTGNEGHLYLEAGNNGYSPHMFLNPGTHDAHIWGNGLDKNLRTSESSGKKWTIHGISITDDGFEFFKNGINFTKIDKLNTDRYFNGFSISTNGGGEGYVDYIILK